MARSKKSKTPPATQSIQQHTLAASPVALLIDGENVIAPELIAPILVEAGKMGSVVIRQVYGNWAAPSMNPWKDMMTHHALERMGNVPPSAGRNATDIALVIGAMDLLYRGVRLFCLVEEIVIMCPWCFGCGRRAVRCLGSVCQTLRTPCRKCVTGFSPPSN